MDKPTEQRFSTGNERRSIELEERYDLHEADLRHLGAVWARRLQDLIQLPQSIARRFVRELEVIARDGGNSVVLDLGDSDSPDNVVPTFTLLPWLEDEARTLADQHASSRSELFGYLVERHQEKLEKERRE